jgi:hypothetical protein
MKPHFEYPRDVFDRMVNALSPQDLRLYRDLRAVRTETAYVGRSFLAFSLDGGKPWVHDRLVVTEFSCDPEVGVQAVVRSGLQGESFAIGYEPKKLGRLKAFMWVPLHARVHWDLVFDHDANSSQSRLGFNLCLLVEDRRTPDREGVLHMETGREFSRRFPGVSTSQFTS